MLARARAPRTFQVPHRRQERDDLSRARRQQHSTHSEDSAGPRRSRPRAPTWFFSVAPLPSGSSHPSATSERASEREIEARARFSAVQSREPARGTRAAHRARKRCLCGMTPAFATSSPALKMDHSVNIVCRRLRRRRPPRRLLCRWRRHESRRRVDPRRVRRRRRARDECGRRRVHARRAGPVRDHALDRRDGLRRGVVLVDAEDLIKALVLPDRPEPVRKSTSETGIATI